MAAASAAAAGGTGAWLALTADDPLTRWANGTAAGLAVVLLAGGLALRWPLAVPLAVLALGGGYAAMLGLEGGALDGRAPAVAAALFLVAELGYWSLELHDAVVEEAGAYLRRVGLLSVIVLGTLAVGAGLLAVVDAGERGGVGLEALGGVAAVAALALVAIGTRRPHR